MSEELKKKTTKAEVPKKVGVKTSAKVSTKKVEAKPTTKKNLETKQSADLPKEVFNCKVSTQAVFDTIMSERASRRQGTHKVKHRGEVRGGGKKPFAQKHTGRARAGSTRSPIWVGGGTVFGPNPERNYNLKINKKLRKLAFASALTLKAKDGAVITYEFKLEKISTQKLLGTIESLNLAKDLNKKVLIVTDDAIVFKSGANATQIKVQKLSGLSVETIIAATVMIISKEDIKKLEGMVK